MQQDLIGETIGDFKIVAEIGRGGMGTVYEAIQVSLDRKVALKILHPHLSIDSRFIKRFLREASSSSSLDHPNIIPTYDSGEANGYYYIAMKQLTGRTLSEVLESEQKLDIKEAISIAKQVAQGLNHAHSRGIIHRDIKPSNIFIGEDNHVTLVDFGIVKAADGTTLTHTGTFLGTPQYMSPEQAEVNEIDARADIYSLGIVIFEMLAGRVPFQADTPVAVLHKHVHERAPRLSSITPSIPKPLEGVVLKTLSKNPINRYQSAQDLCDDLIRLEKDKPVNIKTIPMGQEETAVMEPTVALAGVAPRRRKWLPWAIVGALLFLLIGSGLGTFAMLTREGEEKNNRVAAERNETNTAKEVSTPQPASPPESELGAITGIIKSKGLSVQPVKNVQITIDGKTATTDDSGNYRIAGISAGTHTLSATSSDYEQFEQNVSVKTGDNEINIDLIPIEIGIAMLAPGSSLISALELYGTEDEKSYNDALNTYNYQWSLPDNLFLNAEVGARGEILNVTLTSKGSQTEAVDFQGIRIGNTAKEVKQKLGEPYDITTWAEENQKFYKLDYKCGPEGSWLASYTASWSLDSGTSNGSQSQLDQKKITSISLWYKLLEE